MATNGLHFHFPRKIHLTRSFFYGKKHFSKSEHSGGDSTRRLPAQDLAVQWIYDIETLTLFHCHKHGVDLWDPALGEGTSIQRATRYVCTEENTAVEPRGCPSTTAGTRAGMQKIISTTLLPALPREPTTFQEVLEEWGNTWMWEGLRISGDGTWVREAIRDNSLVAITHRSYMKDLSPNMNSCAFILECTKKRGRITGAFPEQTTEAGSY